MEFNLNNSILYEDRQSPVDCFKLNVIALYCMIILVISIKFNSLLLTVFMKYKSLRTNINMFIIVLTLLNLVVSILEFSFIIPANLKCRFY